MPVHSILTPTHESQSDAAFAARRGSGGTMTLLALAFGTFCIGTTEFASMGIIQLFAETLSVDIPTATHAITAYAIGVVLGAPLLTLFAASINRRTLLLALIGVFILGNVLSATAQGLPMLVFSRFITGLPQGAYFGAGALVAAHVVGSGHAGRAFAIVMTGLTVATIIGSPLATYLGQNVGWRMTYLCIAGLGGLSLLSLWVFIPRTKALDGASVLHELEGLRKVNVWVMMGVAALGISSIFAVYTFIAPLVTDLVSMGSSMIPVALTVFGVGMTVGNLYGGRMADTHHSVGIVAGFGSTLLVLVGLAAWGDNPWIFFPAMFGVGATMMAAIPTIQVRLVELAPQSATLMGAMNLASLNVANALGAWAGSVVIGAGYGLLSASWAGFAMTSAGLLLFICMVVAARQPRLQRMG